VARVRSALIDGGRVRQGPALHTYFTNQLGANPLNVMIATHYDQDHLPGLTHLLLRTVTYNVRIYDQGWPSGGQPDILRRYLQPSMAGMTTGRCRRSPACWLARAGPVPSKPMGWRRICSAQSVPSERPRSRRLATPDPTGC